MANGMEGMSDKALAVFAFAAYHELESGQPVSSVARRDGAGHSADEDAIKELQAYELVTVDGEKINFTERGGRVKSSIIDKIRAAIKA